MATGFIQRWKGKVTTFAGGIYQNGVQSLATFVNSGAPTSGTSGTLANIAPAGSELVDTTTGYRYTNTGTTANPTWTAGTGGLAPASVANPVTAAGTTRAGAAALTAAISVVATAAAGSGVKLLSAATLGIGASQTIYNNTATAIKVYGAVDPDTIDTTAGSTGVTLSGTAAARFTVMAASTFQSNLLGLKSA